MKDTDKKKRNATRLQRGFSLLEFLVAVAILTTVIAVVTDGMIQIQKNSASDVGKVGVAQENPRCRACLQERRIALRAHFVLQALQARKPFAVFAHLRRTDGAQSIKGPAQIGSQFHRRGLSNSTAKRGSHFS